MSKILIYDYNNYYNRIIKRENTIGGYNTAGNLIYNNGGNVTNFDPNDGITTELIIGNEYNGTGDYLLVVDNDYLESFAPVSRWFITEHQRTRQGQFRLTLRRDIIADYYNQVIVAPMVVNRAMISNENSPLLFNSEGFSFNQIKTNEILLKDVTQMPWYVLYFKLNTRTMNISFSTADISWDVDDSYDVTSDNSKWKTGTYYNTSGWKFKFDYNPTFDVEGKRRIDQFQVPDNVLSNISSYGPSNTFIWFNDDRYTVADKLATAFNQSVVDTTLIPAANSQYYAGVTLKTDNEVTEYNKYKGQTFILRTIVQSVVNYYKVTVNVEKTRKTGIILDSSTLYSTIKDIIDNNHIGYTGSLGSHALEYEYYENKINISTVPYNVAGSYNFQLDLSNYANCVNAPYYIMAIPMYELDVESSGGMHCISKQVDNQMLVNAIIKATGESGLLDAQILPYFPYVSKFPDGYIFWEPNDHYIEIDNFVQTGGVITDFLSSRQYKRQYRSGEGEENYGVNMFFIDNDSFTFDITESLSIPVRTADPALNKKLANEVDMYRLCSPNYNGTFEFSVAKNNGVNYFNVDVTLKPYNPYIHINPNFKSIYGSDFNDSRGLICQGDFSIPIVNDPWIQYEYQNKNYLNAFNRQIENLEFTQAQEKEIAPYQLVAGAIGGAAAGGLAGSRLGFGIKGAVAGAALGGVASTFAGVKDYTMMGARHEEAKDFAIDNFKFQLGNIKALPYNINKVTCLTFNNKLWPFLEYYTATDDEISILNNKILYNSMTVNAVGSIEEYKQNTRTFISGDLIRLENTGLSSNEIYEIYQEIKRGLYI